MGGARPGRWKGAIAREGGPGARPGTSTSVSWLAQRARRASREPSIPPGVVPRDTGFTFNETSKLHTVEFTVFI